MGKTGTGLVSVGTVAGLALRATPWSGTLLTSGVNFGFTSLPWISLSQLVPASCLLLSRRVARREENVLALPGVLQTRKAKVMLPAVSPCRWERRRSVNLVRANAFAVGGRVQALTTACWSYLVQTGSAAVMLPDVSPCCRERGRGVNVVSAKLAGAGVNLLAQGNVEPRTNSGTCKNTQQKTMRDRVSWKPSAGARVFLVQC